MGFFSNLKSLCFQKRGYELACTGKINEAIKCFNEAYLEATDLKTSTESKSWYHFCLSLKNYRENNLEKSKAEYAEFKSLWQSYVDVCNLTPGFGTRTRYFVWEQQVKDFAKKHEDVFSKIMMHGQQ